MLARALAATLDDLRVGSPTTDPALINLVTEYAEFLDADPGRVFRGGGPEHFTASGVIFSPDLRRTLLCFHGKGDFWVQLGGHLEPEDDSPAAGALRECREESGLAGVELLLPAPIDLNRHRLGTKFGSCQAHWDVVYALVAPLAEPVVSEESKDVAWFDVDRLPADCAPGFHEQFAAALARVRAAIDPIGGH